MRNHPDNAPNHDRAARTSAGESSGSASDHRSNQQSGEQQSAVPPPSKPDAELTDAEYLARQADEAMRALKTTASDVIAQLGEGVNPVEWAKRYPWAAMAASAVAGFAATALVVPSREQQALNRLAAIERALSPAPKRRESEPGGDAHSTDAKRGGGGGSFLTMIAREVIGAVRPAIVSLVTTGVATKGAQSKKNEEDQSSPDDEAAGR